MIFKVIAKTHLNHNGGSAVAGLAEAAVIRSRARHLAVNLMAAAVAAHVNKRASSLVICITIGTTIASVIRCSISSGGGWQLGRKLKAVTLSQQLLNHALQADADKYCLFTHDGHPSEFFLIHEILEGKLQL